MKQGRLIVAAVAVVIVAIGLYVAFGGDERATDVATPAGEDAATTGQQATTDEATAPTDAAATPESEPVAEAQTEQPDAAEVEAQPQVATLEGTTEQIESEAAAPGQELPSFDLVRVEKSGETVVAGRGPPGSTVTVYDGDRPIGSVPVGQSGSWVVLPSEPLAPGNHQLSLRAVLPDATVLLSANTAVVAVPEPDIETAAASTASATVPAGGAQSETPGPLVVLVPNSDELPSQVLQKPQAVVEEGIRQDQLSLETVDYDESGKAVVSGKAEPGSRVVVYLDNEPLAEARADAEGNWPAKLETPIAPGLHSLRVDQLDASGKVVARVETPFARADMGEALVAENQVIVQPGNSLWRIARRVYGTGFRYTVIYEANAERIGDPDLIYPGQIFSLPATE